MAAAPAPWEYGAFRGPRQDGAGALVSAVKDEEADE